MRFQVLGPLRVIADAEALGLGSPQQQRLLALLCASPNEPIAPDRLVDEIWGEDPPPSAHHLVQVYVSRLRKVLGDTGGQPRVARGQAGYLLRVEPEEIDSLRLLALLSAAEELDNHDPAATWRILGDATELWKGAPFGELADDSDALRLAAIKLTQSYLRVVETRIDAGLELGYHRELVGELDELTTSHPYREHFWQQLMLALYRSGRQAEALRAFRTLRATLGEDLGIEPGPAAADLEGRILLHDRELLWEPLPPPSNLPPTLSAFVGRTTEVSMVGKLLHTARLVTLTGPGGIGKTRLAVETARSVAERFPDGVWWIDLAPLAAANAVVSEVARALGVSAQPGRTITESVIQSLVRRNALLVIDNCEHVGSAVAEFAAEALGTADGIQILATSRVPLHIPGESLWIVPGLSMPDAGCGIASEFPYSDAIQLFVERGAAVAPFFRLHNENAADVVEICHRLDGMPLGIEMAAAHLRVSSPRAIANALGNRFEVLAQVDRGSADRHKTLQAALDWSYDLLDPEARTAFDNLAVFPGPFDLDAATEIAFSHVASRKPLETMGAVVESSLVANAGGSGGGARFRLLETLREYGVGNLRRSGKLDHIRSVHANYFISLFSSAARDIGEPPFIRWMSRLADCYGDVQQALDWSLKNNRSAEAIALAPALQHYWYRIGDAREALLWGSRMLAGFDGAAPEFRAAAHSAVSFGMTIVIEDPEGAIARARQAVELYRQSADQRGLVTGLFGHASAALVVGDIETVRSISLEGLAVSDEIGYSWGRGVCLSMLAFSKFFGGGSLDAAREIAVEAVSLLGAAGDIGGQVVLNPISAIALKQGDLDSAERYALDTAGIAVGSGWEASALDILAQVHIAKGEIDRAEATLQRAVLRALDTGLENWFRMALRDLAQVACHRGDAVRAAKLIGASRRNMPMWGLDPDVYEAVETACTDALGAQALGEISAEGNQLSIEQLLDLVISD